MPYRRLFLAFVVTGAVLTVTAVASGTRWIVPPGNEAVVGRFLAEPGDGGPCTGQGAAIEPSRIVLTFDCSGVKRSATLAHASAKAPGPMPSTERFSLVATDLPPEAIERLLARVRRNERDFVWRSHGDRDVVSRSHGSRELVPPAKLPAARRTLLLSTLILALFGIATTWLHASATSRAALGLRRLARRERPALVSALSCLAVAVAAALASVAETRFLHDDYQYLLQASFDPWSTEHGGRWFSVSWLYAVAARLNESHAVFAIANFTALVGCTASAFCFFRRIGYSFSEGVLAASLLSLAPEQALLMRWPAAFQQSFANALVFLLLIQADAFLLATRQRAPRRAIASALGATGFLLVLSVVTKYGVALGGLAVAGVWVLFGRGRAPSTDELVRRAAFILFALLISAGAFWVAVPFDGSGDFGKLGVPSLAELWHGLLKPLAERSTALFYATALLVALGVGAELVRRRKRSSVSLSSAAALLGRRALLPLCAPLPVHRAWFVVLGGFCLFLIPFCFTHFPVRYYGRLAFAAIAAGFARPLSRAISSPWLVPLPPALLAMALFLGDREPPSPFAHARDGVEAWVRAAGRALHGRNEPATLVVSAGCGGKGDARNAAELLRHFQRFTDDGEGLRWATGFRRATVRFEANSKARTLPTAPDTLELSYCGGLEFEVRSF